MSRLIDVLAFSGFLILSGIFQGVVGQGLIVNEISNGESINREFIELLVVHECPSQDSQFLDIRGWIVDDNNGDFACDPINDVGIRTGHIRFDSSGVWDSIPYGSLILLYNNMAKNQEITMPDDPTDANGDLVYVVPVNYAGIEYNADAPRGSGSCGNLGSLANDTYTTVNPYYNGNPWSSRIQMRDEGDAIQTRRPDGSYFHGISWGIGDMNGGPDSLQVGFGTGTFKGYQFTTGDYRDVNNYDSLFSTFLNPSIQSPGRPNNAVNQTFIQTMQVSDPCPTVLPVLLAGFGAELDQNKVNLNWVSALEINSQSYLVERADHGSVDFHEIGRVDAAGDSEGNLSYTFTDHSPKPGTSFYRLKMLDWDGSITFSEVRAVTYLGNHLLVNVVYPNPVTDLARFEVMSKYDYAIGIFDMQGRQVALQSFASEQEVQTSVMDLQHLEQGMYIYLVRSRIGTTASGRLLKQ